jgi:hypothetical protein
VRVQPHLRLVVHQLQRGPVRHLQTPHRSRSNPVPRRNLMFVFVDLGS